MPRIQARAGPRHQHSSSPLIQEGQIHHLLGLDLKTAVQSLVSEWGTVIPAFSR